MRRLLAVFAILTAVVLGAYAQEEQQARMEQIRSDKSYRWGEARSASQDEAREEAKDNLVSKLKTVLVSESKMTDDDFSNTTVAVTVGAIENLGEIYYRDGNEWVCMAYVSEADLQNAEKERQASIREMVKIGMGQEQELNISEALKYYTWALRMLNVFHDKISIDTKSGPRDAKTWLSAHIPSMLSQIRITIPEDKIAEDPNSYDRYIVNIEATYADRPVSLLDISYFNGERQVSPVHCKSGEGILMFHDLSGFKNIDLRIIYDYPAEGRLYSQSLAAAYPKKFKRMEFDERAGLKLPVKLKKDKLAATESAPETPGLTDSPADAGAVADAAPIIKEPRKTIARDFKADAAAYTAAMQKVEAAIRSKDYASVKDDFTPEGYRVFEMMMGAGNVSVTRKEIAYTVEESGNFIVGKSIPVAVTSNKHVSKENIVFRFNKEDGKIKSVAYALTQRAENDIFRDAQWSMDSRYALLQFMEDYQTAYALKRLDYIESIFSDDAIIITGTMKPKAAKRFYSGGDLKGTSLERNVNYTTYTKDSYVQKLKEDFRKKSYVQLVFEETSISKAGGTDGIIDHEVLWIELKQNYYSSNYNDKGYLALQINLKPVGSQINVRTWTPYFVPMDHLKKAFPIGN